MKTSTASQLSLWPMLTERKNDRKRRGRLKKKTKKLSYHQWCHIVSLTRMSVRRTHSLHLSRLYHLHPRSQNGHPPTSTVHQIAHLLHYRQYHHHQYQLHLLYLSRRPLPPPRRCQSYHLLQPNIKTNDVAHISTSIKKSQTFGQSRKKKS